MPDITLSVKLKNISESDATAYLNAKHGPLPPGVTLKAHGEEYAAEMLQTDLNSWLKSRAAKTASDACVPYSVTPA